MSLISNWLPSAFKKYLYIYFSTPFSSLSPFFSHTFFSLPPFSHTFHSLHFFLTLSIVSLFSHTFSSLQHSKKFSSHLSFTPSFFSYTLFIPSPFFSLPRVSFHINNISILFLVLLFFYHSFSSLLFFSTLL